MTKKLLDSIIIFRFDKIKIAKEELYVQKKKEKKKFKKKKKKKNQFEKLMLIIVN